MTNEEKREERMRNSSSETKHRKKGSEQRHSGFLDAIGGFIRKSLVNGFLGMIFSGYTKLQDRFSDSRIGLLIKSKPPFRRARKKLADMLESGVVISSLNRLISFLCAAPLNMYGWGICLFGISLTAIFAFSNLEKVFGGFQSNFSVGASYVYIGVIAILLGLAMLRVKRSISQAINESFIFGSLFKELFGFSDEAFDANSELSKTIEANKFDIIFTILGLLLGVISIFVHPSALILLVLAFIGIILIAYTPEIGVIATFVSLPFSRLLPNSTMFLCGLIILTALFYLIKLLRGKRSFKFEIIDLFILLFIFMIFVSIVGNAGGEAATYSILIAVTLMSGYFLIVNLLRTQNWIRRATRSLIYSAAVVALIEILRFILNEAESIAWLKQNNIISQFAYLLNPLFDSPDTLAPYLVMIFPFALADMCTRSRGEGRFGSFVISILLATATTLTWSRAAWLALITSTLLFYLIGYANAFRSSVFICTIITIFSGFLPKTFVNRFLSIASLSDPSNSHRLFTWKSTITAIREYFITGIGYGNEAFSVVYPHYLYSGMDIPPHSYNLFLQIFLGLGFFGIIVFAVILFLYFQKCFGYMRVQSDRKSKFLSIAAITAILAAIVCGMFNYIWYDNRVMYMFWVVIALGCAIVRVGNAEIERKKASYDN